MHSFGAKHDPEASLEPECTPQDKVGTYVHFTMGQFESKMC